MPAGRPSNYLPEYCDKLITHMSQGYSFESFGGTIGIDRSNLYRWIKKHPEFRDAKKRAYTKCQIFWEKMGMMGMLGAKEIQTTDGKILQIKSFNAAIWIFNMKNRFKWTDRSTETKKIEITRDQAIEVLKEDLKQKGIDITSIDSDGGSQLGGAIQSP